MGKKSVERAMRRGQRVRGDSLVFLDQTVPTFFGDAQYLSSFTRKMWAHKIYRIGQLIAMTEDEVVRHARRTKPTVISQVKSRLQDVGLHFGMDVSGWNNPDHSFRKTHSAAAMLHRSTSISSR